MKGAKQQRPITVADLPDSLGVPGSRPLLLCDECFTQASADAGDYWNLPADHVLTHCGRPMRLVRKQVRFVDVKLKRKP